MTIWFIWHEGNHLCVTTFMASPIKVFHFLNLPHFRSHWSPTPLLRHAHLYLGMRKSNLQSSSNQSGPQLRSEPALELHSRATSSVGITSPFQRSQHRKQFRRKADKKKIFRVFLPMNGRLKTFLESSQPGPGLSHSTKRQFPQYEAPSLKDNFR